MLQSLFGQRSTAPSARQTPKIQTITPQELHQRLQKQEPVVLVDVRSPDEYQHDGHIRGSRLLPLPVLLQRSNELAKDSPIICVCRSGNRSHVACEQLASRGFTNVTNLVGGMIGWSRSRLPVE
ncbi:MAG: rhodanese-like domain-containing protein [Anaerolineales bacterium]|nr:rhodanese-like domain-containing protein [Anaerolineales bacterium]